MKDYFFMMLYALFYFVLIYSFFMPVNPYMFYISNFIFIMEIFYWFLLICVAVFYIFFLFINKNLINQDKELFKDMDKFEKVYNKYKEKNSKWYYKVLRYLTELIDIAMVVFVGIFIGDLSLFFVMFLVRLFSYLFLKEILKFGEVLEKNIKDKNI